VGRVSETKGAFDGYTIDRVKPGVSLKNSIVETELLKKFRAAERVLHHREQVTSLKLAGSRLHITALGEG
jgi:hypothetical protein